MYPKHKITKYLTDIGKYLVMQIEYIDDKNIPHKHALRLLRPVTPSQEKLTEDKLKVLMRYNFIQQVKPTQMTKLQYKDLENETQFTLPDESEIYTKKNPYASADSNGTFRPFSPTDEVIITKPKDDEQKDTEEDIPTALWGHIYNNYNYRKYWKDRNTQVQATLAKQRTIHPNITKCWNNNDQRIPYSMGYSR